LSNTLPHQHSANGTRFRLRLLASRLPTDRHALWLGLILGLAACLPVLVARYPQMSDYPAHLARYYVMLDAGRSPALAHWYTFRWEWTGNVGVDLLIWSFAAVFGVEQGARVIAGLIPPLTALGILAVELSLRRRVTPSSFIAFAFIWSPMMLIGLLNFTLGLALALLAFALWVRMAGQNPRAALFLPLGLVVLLCHLSAWGVLGVMVFAYEWQRREWRPGGLLKAVVAPWPLLVPLLPMVLGPMLHGNGTRSNFSYGSSVLDYKMAIWLRAMRDTSYAVDMTSMTVVAGLVLAAIGFRRFDWRLGAAALIMLAMSLAMPRHVSGVDYADFRMISTGSMLAALAIDWRWPRWAFWGAPLLYAGRLAITTLSWQADSAQTAALLQALDHVPHGANVASAVLVPGEAWRLDHFEHIGAYAVLRRDAMVNANFAVPHVHMLHLRQGGFADPSHRIRQPGDMPVDLAHFAPAQNADFLWYVGVRPPASLPPGARVIWQLKPVPRAGRQFSLLARLAKPASRD